MYVRAQAQLKIFRMRCQQCRKYRAQFPPQNRFRIRAVTVTGQPPYLRQCSREPHIIRDFVEGKGETLCQYLGGRQQFVFCCADEQLTAFGVGVITGQASGKYSQQSQPEPQLDAHAESHLNRI